MRGLWWQREKEWARHAWWQFVVILDDEFGADRDAVIARLQQNGVDARRLYYPMHQQPIYEESARKAVSIRSPTTSRLGGSACPRGAT